MVAEVKYLATLALYPPGRAAKYLQREIEAESRDDAERKVLARVQSEGHVGQLRVALLAEVTPPNAHPVALPSAVPFERRRHRDYPHGLCNRCGRHPHRGECKPLNPIGGKA